MNTNFIKNRNLFLSIFFTIITGGLYGLYWFFSLVSTIYVLDDCDDNLFIDIILCFITCGLYTLYLVYKISKKLISIETKSNRIPVTSPGLNLILAVFALLLVDLILIQNTLNQIKRDATSNNQNIL